MIQITYEEAGSPPEKDDGLCAVKREDIGNTGERACIPKAPYLLGYSMTALL